MIKYIKLYVLILHFIMTNGYVCSSFSCVRIGIRRSYIYPAIEISLRRHIEFLTGENIGRSFQAKQRLEKKNTHTIKRGQEL